MLEGVSHRARTVDFDAKEMKGSRRIFLAPSSSAVLKYTPGRDACKVRYCILFKDRRQVPFS